MQNNFKLPGGILLEVTGMAMNPVIWLGSVKIEARQTLDIGLKKEFFKGRLFVHLNGKDILGTGKDYYYSSNYGGMITEGIRSFDDRRFLINVRYNFGNRETGSVKSKSSAMQEELDRIEE